MCPSHSFSFPFCLCLPAAPRTRLSVKAHVLCPGQGLRTHSETRLFLENVQETPWFSSWHDFTHSLPLPHPWRESVRSGKFRTIALGALRLRSLLTFKAQERNSRRSATCHHVTFRGLWENGPMPAWHLLSHATPSWQLTTSVILIKFLMPFQTMLFSQMCPLNNTFDPVHLRSWEKKQQAQKQSAGAEFPRNRG